MDIKEIYFEKLPGNGTLNFILVHNAGGNHLFFTHQIELLKKYGDVIWLDLPGHSQSKGISGYQMSDLSLIVNQICKNLSLENVCLVGLNNGADIIIDIALNFSLPVKNIILIDPPIFMEKSFVAEINNFINALENNDYNSFVTSLVNDLFIHTCSENKSIAMKAFNSVDKKALQNIFKGLIEWDAQIAGKLKNITFPTLCILTDEHHCKFSKLKKEAPQFELGKVIGSKCWATLEVPEQINAMIERFLILNR
ncbi:alpha/beta fold hydrolase [Legionella dresdenensis]|uniref:Alpha/beta fold hydrolase n=1 Tax=Legionella dresdenensis TaxID=450200 RepID=A0ABV8CG79_9GAMM